jgi:ABC-type proline/glycine betaine transport system permease subunit
MSTLSLGSLLAVMSIVLGMRLGIGWLERTERVG